MLKSIHYTISLPSFTFASMHNVSIENISKSLGTRSLFKNISFNIEQGDKIALVAKNGTGKSTLLKIIAGLDHSDTGKVWTHKDIHVVLLPQEPCFEENKSIWENILASDSPAIKAVKAYESCLENEPENAEKLAKLAEQIDAQNAWSLESEVKQILGKLNLHHLTIPVKNLSGGQKKRVALARTLIEAQLHENNSLLILDEPTNHLDVQMIEWLESYLSTKKITLLLVTHDRYFLDAVCNEIIEIDQEKIFIYKGNYDYFLEQKSLRHEIESSELKKDKNIFRKELEWMRKQPKARTTKSKSRQDAFGALEEKISQRKEQTEINIQVKMTRLGGKILEMKKVYKSYGELSILKGFDYTFKKGERIGIVGKNGVGKSTFLKIALQEELPDSGKINHGETVVFGNFSQEGLQYKEDKRAIEYVKTFAEFFPLANGTKISATQFMENFGFSAEQQYTPLSKLSGGEKRRLHLLSVLFLNPNFLILDEPTNDLDLQTLRILEEFLLDFPGCILMVSHDRYFMDRMVDHLFVFEGNGTIKDFPGNYTQYRFWKEQQEKNLTQNDHSKTDKQKPEVEKANIAPQKKLTFKEKFELEAIEKELPLLLEEKKQLEQKLQAGNLNFEELQNATRQIGIILTTIEEKEWRWLELSEGL